MAVFEELGAIPPFNPDLEAESNAGVVARFRDALQTCDAVLFSTPEYAHGIPGVLKNELDWVVGSGELSGKPVALINASSRGSFAQASLKEILKTMDARVLDSAEVTVDLIGKNLSPRDITSDSGSSSRLLGSPLTPYKSTCHMALGDNPPVKQNLGGGLIL